MTNLLTKAWIQNRKQEYYYKKAKAENYRSRATYKLSQAAMKYHFIRRGDVVVDLGAAPGGWIQAARKIVGQKGFVLGVDLKPIDEAGRWLDARARSWDKALNRLANYLENTVDDPGGGR